MSGLEIFYWLQVYQPRSSRIFSDRTNWLIFTTPILPCLIIFSVCTLFRGTKSIFLLLSFRNGPIHETSSKNTFHVLLMSLYCYVFHSPVENAQFSHFPILMRRSLFKKLTEFINVVEQKFSAESWTKTERDLGRRKIDKESLETTKKVDQPRPLKNAGPLSCIQICVENVVHGMKFLI